MKKKIFIGIDLGGTNLKIGAFDRHMRFVFRKSLSTADFSDKEALIDAIVRSVEAVLAHLRTPRSSVAGLGVGLPGPVDEKKGIVHFFPNIPGWKNVALRSILKKRLRIPVSIDNDANAMAWAEYTLGAARGARNAVCLTLGTGVGGGLIIEGRLFRGSSGAAGEIGHMPINERGPECNCGGMACLESYIGNRAIMRRASGAFKKAVRLEELSRRAHRGDKKAISIWQQAGRRLGIALIGVVNLLNPDCIVIGGGVAEAGRVLFDAVEETVLTYAMIVQVKRVRIVKARLGSDAGMIGAALLAKEEKD